MDLPKSLPKILPGNIWSQDPHRAVFTNPTEIAYFRGTLKHHYPVWFKEREYKDAEHAYKDNKPEYKDYYKLCTEIIIAKFECYPFLADTIEMNGGEDWIKACSHHVYGKSKFWEGDGLKSGFIRCLLIAYQTIQSRKNSK